MLVVGSGMFVEVENEEEELRERCEIYL